MNNLHKEILKICLAGEPKHLQPITLALAERKIHLGQKELQNNLGVMIANGWLKKESRKMMQPIECGGAAYLLTVYIVTEVGRRMGRNSTV